MRRSAAAQRARGPSPMSPASAAMRPRASRANTSTWRIAVEPGLRRGSDRGVASASATPDRPRPGRRAGTRRARLARRRRHHGARPTPPRAPPALGRRRRGRGEPAEMDPGERRHAHVAGGFGLDDRDLEGGGAGVVVTGLALRPAEAGQSGRPRSGWKPRRPEVAAARPRWRTASSKRCWMRASSPSIASRRTCSQGSSTTFGASAGPGPRPRRCAAGRRRRSRLGRRRGQFAAWSHGRSKPRRRAPGCGR